MFECLRRPAALLFRTAACIALLCALGAGPAGAQDRRQNAPGAFDFYVLSLSWSPSFCAEAEERGGRGSRSQQCSGRPYSFVVHGLWPQYENGYPEYCEQPAPRLPRNIMTSMLDLMPAPGLIYNEWDKHGTCAGLSAKTYFETIRKARAAIKIPEEFLDLSQAKTVTPTAVEEAFIKANPKLTSSAIAITCNRTRLSEVRICLSKDLEFRNCDEVDRQACRRDEVNMPPVRGGQQSAGQGPGVGKPAFPAAGCSLSAAGASPGYPFHPERRNCCGMNYRHAFHAGGFADVIKHIVLTRILVYLQEKPAAFRVIDTHAGAGLYDLTGDEATRSGEFLTGIARLLQARLSEQAYALVAPYLDIVRSFNPPGELVAYPGSPLIARALLRPQDRMTLCELAPVPRKQLIDALRRDTQARVVDLDGWVALPAFVPPNERRGLVLIDPAFEAKDEFERLADRFATAFAKWTTGIYVLWYPAKSRRATEQLAERVAHLAAAAKPPGKVLRIEFSVAPQIEGEALTSTGLLVVNPPWTLHDELKLILQELQRPLGQGGAARFRLEFPKA